MSLTVAVLGGLPIAALVLLVVAIAPPVAEPRRPRARAVDARPDVPGDALAAAVGHPEFLADVPTAARRADAERGA